MLGSFNTSRDIARQCLRTYPVLTVGKMETLLQDNKPVWYASRSLLKAEQNYAQIEKELIAIVFTCKRFHHVI